MRFSEFFCPTYKESPNDAEIISHQLMVRAGLIRKVSSGIYNILPFGLRAIRKFEAIVREEMERAGAQEAVFPSVIPSELWIKSGRWEVYGKELLRIRDRHDNQFCYGPTHEEVVTDLVKDTIKSYKTLPMNIFQIQTKFRDEIRPRFGLMRSREFVMKDAYSFHENTECLDRTYLKMVAAYQRIFDRCGLDYKMVKAAGGSIGGDESAEFMVTAQSGEDVIVECNTCGYAANLEIAESENETDDPENLPKTHNKSKGLSEISTPGIKTVEEYAEFAGVSLSHCLKTLLFVHDGTPVMVLLRGDHELNMMKLEALFPGELERASVEVLHKVTGASPGSIGPVGLKEKVIIVADDAVRSVTNAHCGANKTDFHSQNVQIGRDYSPDQVAFIRLVTQGDRCGHCKKGSFQFVRGIEIGHVFKLGNKYSRAMGAQVLDQSGRQKTVEMGCYGIGIGRTIAAAIEQKHDNKGIVWPKALAPFEVVMICTTKKEEAVAKKAEELYEAFRKKGVEVLFDDRTVSPGVKFKDADLMGIPKQVIVGKSYAASGEIEWIERETERKITLSADHDGCVDQVINA